MWISVKKSAEKPLPYHITLIATEWFRVVGSARITYDPLNKTYMAYIESKIPQRGIGKKLCEKLDQVLQALANKTRVRFYHKVHLQTIEAERKLEGYLERYGLLRGYRKEGNIWVKLYCPPR